MPRFVLEKGAALSFPGHRHCHSAAAGRCSFPIHPVLPVLLLSLALVCSKQTIMVLARARVCVCMHDTCWDAAFWMSHDDAPPRGPQKGGSKPLLGGSSGAPLSVPGLSIHAHFCCRLLFSFGSTERVSSFSPWRNLWPLNRRLVVFEFFRHKVF